VAEHVCRCTWTSTPHATWGDCQRSKRIQIGDLRTRNDSRKWDADLTAYETARRSGLRPQTTKRADVDRAVRVSDKTGVAYRADA
jgi:hypothetical protein